MVATAVALSLKTATLPVEVELETVRASPEVAPVREEAPEVTVKVLAAATVVFWFNPMALAVVPLPRSIELSDPGSSEVLMATPERLDRPTLAYEPAAW